MQIGKWPKKILFKKWIYIYILGLTILNLWFIVKEWGLEGGDSNIFKNKNKYLKNLN